MKSLHILSIVLFFSTVLAAQEPLSASGDNYFFFGLTLPITKVRDQAHSPQIYQGLTPSISVGYDQIGRDFVTRFAFSYAFSPLGIGPKARPRPEQQQSSADASSINFSGAVYKRVGDYNAEGWNRYAGAALTFTFDMRQYNLPSNNVFGYQVNTSLNAAGFVRKKLDNSWQFNYEAMTPLVSYALRPNFIGMPPMTSGNFSGSFKRIFTSGKVVTVNKLFRFYNRFSFEKQINDHRKRRYAYTWEACMNRVEQPLNSVSGGLGYESLFKM
jgi:hypothetical protein